MTGEREADLDVALRRVVVGYRGAAVLWMLLLALVSGLPSGLGAGVAAAAAVGLAGLWALATALLAATRPQVLRAVAWLAADTAVAAVTVWAPLWVAGWGGVPTADVASFAGGYPFSAVLLAAWSRGMAGGLLSAAALSVVTSLRLAPLGVASLGEALPSMLVYIAGAAVAAWGTALLRRQDAERREALLALAAQRAQTARERERAETAAHLHDSVLQTLALIQRRADDPAQVRGLARDQERELRDWLSGGAASGASATSAEGGSSGDAAAGDAAAAGGAAAALRELCAEVERRHGVPVEVVVVGDRPLDERLSALLAATGEAVRNAATHSGAATVSVYAEFGEAPAVFVRDRGSGFDSAAVPADRRGIAESVRGRLERHGGTAELRTAPGQGTEWELRLNPGAEARGAAPGASG